MDAFQNLFLRKLVERITAEISTRVDYLTEGKAKDHADYCGRVQYLAALRDVTKWSSEIQKELDKPDDDGSNRASRRPAALYGV